MRQVARWETRGNDYLALVYMGTSYVYEGNSCGGVLPPVENDEAAIAWMERPWSPTGAGPVTRLQRDRPTLKRVK